MTRRTASRSVLSAGDRRAVGSAHPLTYPHQSLLPANHLVASVPKEGEIVAKDDIKTLKEKSIELKQWFKDHSATLEQWKFSVEETKEGMRVEIHAVALITKSEK